MWPAGAGQRVDPKGKSDMSNTRCDELFQTMVESVGVKAFAANMEISTRQVYRMLTGAQPNPVARFCEVIAAGESVQARAVLDYLCQRQGGYFVLLTEDLSLASVNAVKESAEAIVAISEGRPVRVTVKEIREAIAALAALETLLQSGKVKSLSPLVGKGGALPAGT
jgi:hypothetical protein